MAESGSGPIMEFQPTIIESNFELWRKSPNRTADGMLLMLILAPTGAHACISTCCANSRCGEAAVVLLVNSSRTPSLLRTPSAPRFQPADSSAARALSRLYSCGWRFGFQPHVSGGT